jgi:endo-1,4-beta-xylanase
MKVKGHTLVWYNQLPQWVKSLTTAADVRSAMLAHIKGVMQHYKGKVAAWDVVNEAVSIEGTSYRDCPFYNYLGEGYIDEAFKAAKEADPDVKLYYNDYNAEGMTPKADFVYNLVKGLVSRGVPIDGVGMQMHYGKPNDPFTIAELKANMQRYVDLGLDVLYSEMDMHLCDGMTAAEQVTMHHDLVAACVAEPRCTAVTFWGITDKYSWLNSYAPLGCSGSVKPLGHLWDDNFKKKAAYTGVLNALLGL